MRSLKWLLALVGVASIMILLGGSGYRYLFGAHALDIEGVAQMHGGDVELPPPGWPHYGNDPGGHRFSSAALIDTSNVAKLEVAWQFSTGDLDNKVRGLGSSITEGTPILVDGKLVFCTPFNEIIALDPGTGSEQWRFDADIDLGQQPANKFVCRGVVHWSGDAPECPSRILMGTNDGRIIAVDARTGASCRAFGAGGEIKLNVGMELIWPGEFQITSPPVVIGNFVVVGSSISDNQRVTAPHGTVRAFDVRSGESLWEFDPIPRESGSPDWQGSEPPVEGHANAWAPMSVDHERGLVFVPTSSPSPDFYGGRRPGDNRHANSVVALDASDGSVRWAYQVVHHDVWDYDLPAQPGLYTVWRDGEQHDVVAQVTKTGHVFVLDRDTGKPFLPVAERPMPASDIDGERMSPTQPIPTATPGIVPSTLDPDDAFGLTWFDKRACEKALAGLRAEGLFTPPSRQGTLFYPFTGGGANWGGAAYDPRRNLLVINMSSMAHAVSLYPQSDFDRIRREYPDDDVEPMHGVPFSDRRALVLSPLGLPCAPPPWGVLAAVNVDSGQIVWRRALGTLEDFVGLPLEVGTPTIGGPIATAGDVIFIASTLDYYLRAFSIETGEELWKGRLPTSGNATPMTYVWEERQYVVIYAGGNSRIGLPIDDKLIAFALPQE
ncbi:MAG: PQQ-binding-like beta-propeller repeat protein [Woeseiaceae bacterium]|nr:PQQ-binding-like beta-propeller repeat protein [Woeseiaceae bacterium]NIP21882.1 PQQ-binding-like beta-propeller repeat protein [Woeseiaceae bacterium]NIS90967.1 PQQ-binding-like beta-propeller repeat protein [Woeseiaceae bacterium]